MRKARSSIPLRRPVFVGCEGESESGYVGLLQDMIREANVPVHLLIADLGIGAGDPLARVLRHLPRCATRRPPDSPEAERALRREWTDYKKPMARADLATRINLAAVFQAAGVEPELNAMLRCIGLLTTP